MARRTIGMRRLRGTGARLNASCSHEVGVSGGQEMDATRRSGPEQYENATRFNARIALHARFRTNPRPWPVWVFDQLEGHDGCSVLDVGCGTGLLWQVNGPRVPASWTLVLTDSSEGMLAETRRHVDGLACRVVYRVMDAQEITFPDGAFDVVIANHMLYHVPNREGAIAEARRVLREGGAFHATTAGLDSLAELRALLDEYRSVSSAAHDTALDQPPRRRPDPVIGAFSLANGAAQVGKRFAKVETRIYTDELRITDPDAIVDYFLSLNEIREGERVLAEDEAGLFRDFVAARMAREGFVLATNRSGMFVGR
jgi:ubiquinone/menaquinone biosynthesis C-methylase UbiE